MSTPIPIGQHTTLTTAQTAAITTAATYINGADHEPEPDPLWPEWLCEVWDKLESFHRDTLQGPWGPDINVRLAIDMGIAILRQRGLTLEQVIDVSPFFPNGLGSLPHYPGGIGKLFQELWAEHETTEKKAAEDAAAAEAEAAMRQPVDFLADHDTSPPKLRQDHCPEALWPFVKDTSERMGVDPAGVMLCCLVTCASVITDDWRLQPQRHDYTWTENARLWGLIVGNPSVLKTPVIYACTKPIDKLDATARENYQVSLRSHKAALEMWKKAKDGSPEPVPPKMARYIVESTSVEAFSEVLRDDDASRFQSQAHKVLCRQDEMSEFFANQDKYNSSGKSGGEQGAYLRLYNGGRYSLDRIIRGSFAVPNWSACFIGGIQPGPIQKIAKSASEDGLLQRFMYSVPGQQIPGIDRRPDGAAINRYHDLIPALSAMHPTSGTDDDSERAVVLHEDAHKHREEIDALSRAMASLPDTSVRLQSAFGKWRGLFARLCLTFHLIDVADGKLQGAERPYLDVIPEKTARRVARYMSDIVLPHLLRAEAVMYSTVQAKHARWIAGYILARKVQTITARDVVRAYRDLQAPECRDELNSVMASLVTVMWLDPVLPDNPAKPVSTWTVNPLVHENFAGQGDRERERREQARAQAEANFAVLRRRKAEWEEGR